MDFLEIWLYSCLRVTVKYNFGLSGVASGWENLYATWHLMVVWKDADSTQGWASAG